MIPRIATISAIALIALLSVATPTAAAPDQDGGSLQLTVRVDGQELGSKRLRLEPDRAANIELEVRNTGAKEAGIRTVRLAGTALGLTFFAYDTSVALTVPAGESATQAFSLDLSDLDSQVTGLLPTRVALLDADRAVLAEKAATADVRGSLISDRKSVV